MFNINIFIFSTFFEIINAFIISKKYVISIIIMLTIPIHYNGEKYLILMDRRHTIKTLKYKLKDEINISENNQILLLDDGTELDDTKTLSELKIAELLPSQITLRGGEIRDVLAWTCTKNIILNVKKN